MYIKFYFHLPIFYIDIHVRVYENMETLGKGYKQYANKHKIEGSTDGNCMGLVIDDIDTFTMNVWFSREDLNLELLTHECAHLTHAILRCHNMAKKHDQEIYALLNGFLNQTIANKLKQKGITIG